MNYTERARTHDVSGSIELLGYIFSYNYCHSNCLIFIDDIRNHVSLCPCYGIISPFVNICKWYIIFHIRFVRL